MECWYCYWGWPQQVSDIYCRAEQDIDALIDALEGDRRRADDWEWQPEPPSGEWALQYGPAHVVWSDENWDCAGGCLLDCDGEAFAAWEPGVLNIVRRSLRELMALPEEVKNCEPAGYDGERPENFPPPVGVAMVRGKH